MHIYPHMNMHKQIKQVRCWYRTVGAWLNGSVPVPNGGLSEAQVSE